MRTECYAMFCGNQLSPRTQLSVREGKEEKEEEGEGEKKKKKKDRKKEKKGKKKKRRRRNIEFEFSEWKWDFDFWHDQFEAHKERISASQNCFVRIHVS